MKLTQTKIMEIRATAMQQITELQTPKAIDLDNILNTQKIALRMLPKSEIRIILTQLGREPGGNPSGALLRDISIDKDSIHTILINEEMHEESPQRTRFTVAHELGHFFLHTGNEKYQSDIPMRTDKVQYDEQENILEVEANQFAAELLMPFDKMKLIIQMLNQIYTFDDIVLTISQIFNVSTTAARYRYINVLEELDGR